MRILGFRTLLGPNIYLHRPVIVMTLDLEEMHGRESRTFEGFNDRLLETLPELYQHRCSGRHIGGFVERLREGTYLGHVVEHVALELSELAGIPAFFGKSIAGDRDGIYSIVVEFKSERGMRQLMEGAVDVVRSLVEGNTVDIQALVKEAREAAERSSLGPSTRSIVNAAERRGIPWRLLHEDSSIIEFGYGRYRRRIQATMTDRTATVPTEIAGNKQLTKAILSDAAIPVPHGRVVRSLEQALVALKEIGAPVVVKPCDSNQGKGVSLGVHTALEMRRAYPEALRYSSEVIVEEQIEGSDFRILVINGRLAAASRRFPAHVAGDGVHTVRELVEIVNNHPDRGEGHEKPLTKIRLDDIALVCLKRQSLDTESIPERGRVVLLHHAANLSTGGTAEDVTSRVHPDLTTVCERAARLIGLDVCGIDVVVRDVSRPLDRSNGAVIEVNAAPGLRMHLHPSQGASHDVGETIMRMLYPEGAPSRVPIIAITGTNGKTTVTRMIGHMLHEAGRDVGMTTTDGIMIRGRLVATGDLTGARSARSVLTDPHVDVAVLETARGGIMRSGLGFDWADIGIITSIQPDHVGQDGIRNVDDILFVKSLIAERVRPGGTVILNRDDPRVLSIRDLPRVREQERTIITFSLRDNTAPGYVHQSQGEIAYYLRDGWIIESHGLQEQRVVHVSMLPVALGGFAEYNVANAMAAIAAARAFGLSLEQVTASIMRFISERDNPGRANLFRVGNGFVMLDYGHNTHAIEAVTRVGMPPGARLTGVVGLPGDRADWVLEEAARAAARAFDRIIIREDEDLRGRSRGDIPRLIERTVRREAPAKECVVIPGTWDAMVTAIDTMQSDELVVVFYEKFDQAFELLRLKGASPTHAVASVRSVVGVRNAM